MRLNNPALKEILSQENLKINIMSSIAGKYIYLELPYGETIAAEEVEEIEGGIKYFRTEQEALDLIESIKNS